MLFLNPQPAVEGTTEACRGFWDGSGNDSMKAANHLLAFYCVFERPQAVVTMWPSFQTPLGVYFRGNSLVRNFKWSCTETMSQMITGSDRSQIPAQFWRPGEGSLLDLKHFTDK